MMIEKQGVIRNPLGIHCRPADLIRRAVADYEGSLEICANGQSANPRKVLSLLSLGMACGDTFTVRVEGEDEAAANVICEKIVALLEETYDFEK